MPLLVINVFVAQTMLSAQQLIVTASRPFQPRSAMISAVLQSLGDVVQIIVLSMTIGQYLLTSLDP
jgi:hypothetical protein